MNFKEFLRNKWFSRFINVAYILGFIWAIGAGVYGWYFLITAGIFLLLFGKQLWKFMKMGGDMYANWCRSTARKTVGKVNPWKDHVEELKESVGDSAKAGSSVVAPESVTGSNSGTKTIDISENEDKRKDKEQEAE